MNHTPKQILAVLDQCCDSFTFPMLDNGYVYLAATRLSLFRSEIDWAMTIEVFGYSPRAGMPDTHIHTFASNVHNRQRSENYVNDDAYKLFLANHPHNESQFIHPIAEGDWLGEEELVSERATELLVRNQPTPLPRIEQYQIHGITLEQADRVRVYELCRYLAGVKREQLLATPEELRANIHPSLKQILQLDEWHHPDVIDDSCRPSGSKTFQQLAEVLTNGDVNRYQPDTPPNTHWRNWPEGGTL